MTVLLDQHQLLIWRDRDDIDPIDAFEHIKTVFFTGARIDAGVGADFKNTKIAVGNGPGFFPRSDHRRVTFGGEEWVAGRSGAVNSKSFFPGRPTLAQERQQML